MSAITEIRSLPPPLTGRCRACFASDTKVLHSQYFVLPDLAKKLRYDVACCTYCGFVFADNIPRQETLIAHYEESEHHIHPEIPAGLSAIHRDFFDFIRQHTDLSKNTRIIDIGSGMGHFLSLFKAAGHTNILGLEPSRNAKRYAVERYGIDTVPENLSKFKPSHSFGLITMCGVLEHILDIPEALKRIRQIGTKDGYFFLAVPDAASFGTTNSAEPFLEFALEHINFFTPHSLSNLLAQYDFETVAIESHNNSFYNNTYIYGLFRASSTLVRKNTFDSSGEVSINNYVRLSNQRLGKVRAMLDDLASRRIPTIIWGAGALATRLCATTPVDRLRLIGFVDKNPQLHGKTMLGAQIHPAQWLHKQDRACTVVIFSTTYVNDIVKTLTEEFSWTGDILRIDFQDTSTNT